MFFENSTVMALSPLGKIRGGERGAAMASQESAVESTNL
jgi:hypothetical protein